MRLFILLSLVFLTNAPSVSARDVIRVVGSSTLYPLTTIIAENFGTSTAFRTPIVEPTGTGGGFKLFCSGVGARFADIINASRSMTLSESQFCNQNGIHQPVQLQLGYDGIVFANSKKLGKPLALTRKQLFLALAKYVPVDGKLVQNPYKTWYDISRDLPNTPITLYGPPPTSGTRDSLVKLLMQPACAQLTEYVAAYRDPQQRNKACSILREDGVYLEAGENDNLIVQKLFYNKHALGVFGYNFLNQNRDFVHAATIDGVAAHFDTIYDHSYPLSRPLYVYVKREHIGVIAGLKAFASELVSEHAGGEFGYATERGLIPLTAAERAASQARVGTL